MNKKALIVASLVFFCIICYGVFRVYGDYEWNLLKIEEQQIKANIRSNLYPGLSYEEVVAYLTEEKVPFSWREEEEMIIALIEGVYKYNDSGAASVHVYFDSNRIVTDVTIEFVFDVAPDVSPQ